MKTIRFYTAIMIILAIAFAASLNASIYMNVNFENPPETEFDYSNAYNKDLAEFNFEEESYIDDIPFDTECVSKNCIYQKAILVTFNFSEEEYIDDIPFETETIAVNQEFDFEDESYIDDIPFNTMKIAKNYNRNYYVYNQ